MNIGECYCLKFVQSDKAHNKNDGFEYCYVYKFFAWSCKYKCAFKYIIRAEAHDDCFAIKYYCVRNKHSEYKYSRVLNFFSPIEVKRIMEVCASVIPIILKIHPNASFCFLGSQSMDESGRIEGRSNTQRYRIYCELVRRIFGDKLFYITLHNEVSGCVFVNKRFNSNYADSEKRIVAYLSEIYDFEL